MVHLDLKYEYLNNLKRSDVVAILIDELLYDRTGPIDSTSSEASEVAIALYRCVRKNEKDFANDIYIRFSKRQPTKESHWIYDEFVMFALCSAVLRFNLDKTWLTKVLSLCPNTGSEQTKIYDSFRNVLSGNLNTNGDFYQISLVYQHLSGTYSYKSTLVDKMFEEFWKLEFPFYESSFLNIVSLKAIGIALQLKSVLTPDELAHSQSFIKFFLIRTNIISNSITIFLIVGILTGACIGYWKLNIVYPNIFTFGTAISGIGLFSILAKRKLINGWLNKKIRHFFGYQNIK